MPERGLSGSLTEILEVESQAAADGAGRLHQIDGVAIRSHDWDVAFGEKVAEIDEKLEMPSEETGWDRLADKEIQVRVGLSR